jgi:hypothetical protein
MIHAANLVRIAIDAGNFDLSMYHCLHHTLNVKVNRLIILLLQTGKEISVFFQKVHVQPLNKPRSPGSETYCRLWPPSRPPSILVTNCL